MRTCGGERRLSRPIVRCHATSQRRPGKPSQPAPSARAGATATGFFAVSPIDRAQAFGAYANRRFSLVQSQGRTLKRGANGGLTFESRAQIGDFLSVYLQPELLENEDYDAARLATGYAKL